METTTVVNKKTTIVLSLREVEAMLKQDLDLPVGFTGLEFDWEDPNYLFITYQEQDG